MAEFPVLYLMKTLLALLAASAVAVPAHAQDARVDAPPGATSSIGYRTVAEALAAVPGKPGAQVTVTPNGWTVVSFDAPEYAIWSFTPAGHYAHPAAVRRAVVVENGMVRVSTAALCQAAKEPCDRLMAEFAKLNEGMRQDMRNPANR
jgi:hypothetical protein